MSDKSAIQWTDATWNPVTGCTKVSPGCDHCYAETFAERWRGVPGHAYEQGFDLKLWPERLDIPRGWKKPRRIFVNSMSDLFHHDVPDYFIDQVFRTMEDCNWHTFQVLTKRPERMRRFVKSRWGQDPMFVPLHIWLGVSVESNAFTWRVDMLRETPGYTRFLSVEPMLGEPDLNLRGIGWVIVGGESGPGWRPMNLDAARYLRERCSIAKVPFFFKQVAAFRPTDEMIPEDLRIREYPVTA